jgi:hypothetical protein
MFQIDLGNNGGDGINTFLGWSARGTQDGAVRAKQFFLREGSSKDEYAEAQKALSSISTVSKQAGKNQKAWQA